MINSIVRFEYDNSGKVWGNNLSSSEDVLHQTEDSDVAPESGALEVRNLSVGYDDALISEINVSIVQGETIAILGSSGIGKTTLLRTIAGQFALLGRSDSRFPSQEWNWIHPSKTRSDQALKCKKQRSYWCSY